MQYIITIQHDDPQVVKAALEILVLHPNLGYKPSDDVIRDCDDNIIGRVVVKW